MILVYSRFSVDLLLRWAVLLSRYLIVSAGIFVLLLVILGLWKPFEQKAPAFSVHAQKTKDSFVYESIGSGALALSIKQQLGWVADVAKELLIIAHNSRPDALETDPIFLIGLKGFSEELKIQNGKTLFLDDSGEKLSFSKTPSSLWVKPIVLGQEGVLVEVGRKSGPLEAPLGEEKSQFVVQLPEIKGKKGLNGEKSFAVLKTALFWGKDLLIDLYGGKEFDALKEKCQLEFFANGSPYACFIGMNDQLVWKEGEWQVLSLKESGSGLPLAKVVSMGPSGLKLRVWDPAGFYPIDLNFPLQKAKMGKGEGEIKPTAMRLRTATQVSCLFGKKRMVIKPGDWILKVGSNVRNLRLSSDVELCLNHRLKGELFVVDSLEKEGTQWVLKGNLFDPMRTQVVPISFPVDLEKKKTTRQIRKKGKRSS